MDFDLFLRLMKELRNQRVDYVVVGGIALSLHGLVRATEDVDLFVRPTEENVGRLKAALRTLWNDPEIELISAAELAGEYPTIRYGPPAGDLVIDLLARPGEAVRFEDLQVEIVELEGTPIRVASPLSLYRMKRGTVRPVDRADAAALRDKFDVGEE